MANKLNIKNTDYKTRGGYSERDHQAIVHLTDNVGNELAVFYAYSQDVTEIVANTSIISADALNTYDQTPVLPSELLRQRDFLAERLKKTDQVLRSLKMSIMAHPDHELGSEFDDMTDSAEDQEILNKAALKQIENE